MEFTNYFFASIVSFLGLLIGIILIKIAPEEQKTLEKNFALVRKIFLFSIFIFVIFYYFNSWFYLITLIVYGIFLLIIESKVDDLFKKSMIIYTALGVVFFLSSKNINLFTIESSLILLYGLPTASLMYKKREKNLFNIFSYNLGFIIIANLLFFI